MSASPNKRPSTKTSKRVANTGRDKHFVPTGIGPLSVWSQCRSCALRSVLCLGAGLGGCTNKSSKKFMNNKRGVFVPFFHKLKAGGSK